MEGECRFGAFVVVQRFAPQTVAAAAGREVVERLAQSIAAEEPLEGLDRTAAVLGSARQREGGQLGLDESGGLEGLFVARPRRRFVPMPSEVAWKRDFVFVESALVAEPSQ